MSLIALLLAVVPQTSPPPPAPPTVDCTDADHRALDFWVGDWDVYATGGETRVAHSRIEKIVGCAISETYDQTVGPGGKAVDYHGRSISSFVQPDKRWQQYYVDTGGAAATLIGTVTNGDMIFLSTVGPVTNRMTLGPNPDGSVHQRGAFSTDGGKTWSPAYDFTDRKRAAT